MTALHWAAHHDDLDTVKLLIAAGADAKAANRYGVTPLSLACTNGNTAIVELLLEAGADPNRTLPGGETALMTASRTGRLGPVEALLARGADVNAREHKDQTALMWAAAEGHVEVVDALLKAGADFRTPLASGFTPLFFAVREGRTEVVFRLLEAGADVNETMRPRQSATRQPQADHPADPGGRKRPFRTGRGFAESRRRSERSARRLHGAARDHLGSQANSRRRQPASGRIGKAEQPGYRPAACGATAPTSTLGSKRESPVAADSRPRVRRHFCWRRGHRTSR